MTTKRFCGTTIFLAFFLCFFPLSVDAHLGYTPHGVVEAIDQAKREFMAEYGQSIFTLHATLYATVSKKEGQRKTINAGGFVGTAFVIREDGYLLTVAHMQDWTEGKASFIKAMKNIYDALPIPEEVSIEFNAEYYIVNPEGQKFFVDVIAKDVDHDLALLSLKKNDGVSLKAFVLGDYEKHPYGTVVVVGAPIGISDMLVDGVLARTSLHDCDDFKGNYLLFMSPINPGNSGGPMALLETSEVIGIVEAIVLRETGSTSISCGVPSSEIKRFLDAKLPPRHS